MADLHLVQLDLDLRRLGRQVNRMHLPATDDLGYAVHAALDGVFGPKALRPFAVAPRGAPQGLVPVLAYSKDPGPALVDHAERYAEAAWYDTVRWDSFAHKPMPARWESGERVAFDVRACPVVRSKGPSGKAREVDAFLAAVHGVARDAPVDRDAVYRDWSQEQLEKGGVDVEEVSLSHWARCQLVRRTQGSGRKAKVLERPSARFSGVLRVRDGDAFAALLARGVGRHRAFGFGMLLLRPVGR